MNGESGPGNVYSLHPKEVRMTPVERSKFVADLREAIDEGFLFANHSETYTTIDPIELVPITPCQTYDTLTNNLYYDRAFVAATYDRDDGDTYLRQASVNLFRQDWRRRDDLKAIRSDLAIRVCDSDIDEEFEELIDLDDLMFYMDTPRAALSLQKERVPLNYTICRRLLNHIVSMANPIASMTDSDRNMKDSLTALLAVSAETTFERSTKYRFHLNEDEHVTVTVKDGTLAKQIGEPTQLYHEAQIKKIRSFGQAGTLATLLRVAVIDSEVEATIEKEFTYNENTAAALEQYSEEITEEHKLVSADEPQEFMRYMIDGVHMLASNLANSDAIEQLEY